MHIQPAPVPTPPAAEPARTYLLRTCRADLTSYNRFQWPESGPVECPDWSAEAECGNGLHGMLMGQGDPGLLNWDADAKWLVVEVDPTTVVDLNGKVKVPCGVVVFCGDRFGATADIIARGADPALVIGGTATAGDSGTATAGYGGTATAGDSGTATAGVRGTATAGYGGTATAGDSGTATAGDSGTIQIRWWDGQADRYRTAVGDVGENGILPGVAYRVQDGKLVPVEGR